MDYPMQPLVTDEHSTIRFRANAIVRHLLDDGPFSLNTIAAGNFTAADREQFAQLIGYSLCGFEELPYVSDDAVARARVQEIVQFGEMVIDLPSVERADETIYGTGIDHGDIGLLQAPPGSKKFNP